MYRLVVAAAVTLVTAFSAFAADLPARMPAKAPALYNPERLVNWSGFYAGLHAGYGWGSSNWFAPASGLSADMSPDGAVIGGQLGYNYQIQKFVVGAEADIAWSGMKGSLVSATSCATQCETKNPWLGTVRARVGMPFGATGAWLPYVTGGLAYGDVEVSDNGLTRKSTQWGWTAGAGLEMMFAPAWSARVEYLYVDLGKFTTIGDGTAPPFDVKYHANLVRAGVNYHF
jgi:outer membrane immunogenic protein